MGLDGVELVMDVEDRFGTSFPDAEVERMQTVGDLHNFVMARIRSQHSVACPAAAMFYPIRKILVDEFGLDRSLIRPSTNLESLVDENHRGEFWRTIESSLATRLPRLRRSKWLQWAGDTFPPECTTVSQLVDKCVNLNIVTDEFGPDDGDIVFETVRQIVADVAGVDKTIITPKTNFSVDLGF